MNRREMLAGLGAVATGAALMRPASTLAETVSAVPGIIVADASPPRYRILVGGLADGRTARWSKAIALGLEDTLSPGMTLRLRPVGGPDGVTGANRLQTMAVSDGRTAAALPGDAAIAFLTGDPRVHYQPGEWIPILAGLNPGLILLRGGMARLADPVPVRLVAASPESPDLAAILAFTRLGVPTTPVFGLRGSKAATRAFAQGAVDAVMLSGDEIPADAAALEAEGGVPICSLGTVDEQGRTVRDPLFPNFPTVDELAISRNSRPLSPSLNAAYHAVLAASRIDFLMVLPHLTPPAAVALWRQAALKALQDPALKSASVASAISLTVTRAAPATSPLNAPPDALLALQQLLFKRYGWRPH